ncbi:MAG TPA: methyltransferase domain-containing protein [Pusillimonas sp.]|uniref:methyltransferase domain-containing protein n=1 Tax=Pusillimonas sp. TaxID=3040095 RepID=UPI002CA457AD|nr:methyltransferase domain-containing protein [Pusillimonas sp.]HUH87300.1 methyltransferase domain-containing protein [Pusillimonas sp.]
MSQPSTLPLDPAHVIRQFARRAPLDKAQFLYGEIAQRMLQRLSYIKLAPQAVVDAGCGGGHALEPLRARYAGISYTGIDSCPALVKAATERHGARPSLWQKLRNKPTPAAQFLTTDMAATGLLPESQDLVWSNMALHWHHRPHEALAEWRRILRTGGLVMFSCLGPGSFKELREAVGAAGIATAMPQFVDMHDFGDLLIEHGFADPVMDQEVLTLTYRSADKLLDDLRILGGNPSLGRTPHLVGRGWRQRLLDALESRRNLDGTIHLSLEVAYGHAWRAASVRTPAGETRISVDSIGRKPR